MSKKPAATAKTSQRPVQRSTAAPRAKTAKAIAAPVSIVGGRYDLVLAGLGLLVLVLASSSLLLLAARVARWEPKV